MIIREIEPDDLDTVLALNQASVEVLSPLDRSALRYLIDHCALSVVAEISNRVAGFMLTLGPGTSYTSPNYRWFDTNYENFLYIDRIVVSDDYRGNGVATSLYDYLLEFAQRDSVPRLLAEIDIEPPNEGSLRFHQKRGFVEVDRLQHGADKTVSLQQLKLTSKS